MTMCEYDRNLLREVREVLNEIKEILKDTHAIHLDSVNYVVEKNNRLAHIGKEVMQYHLEALERAEEGD